MKSKLILSALTILFLSGMQSVYPASYYSRQSGNWNQSSTWSTGTCGGAAAATVPGAADIVYICNTHTVNVIANANVNSVTIQNGGTLRTGTTGGGANKTITVSGNFVILDGGTYIHNNNLAAATTIFNGTESFSANSNFIVDKWSGTGTPLIGGCNSNFGNLTLNWNPGLFYWNNNGLGYTRTIAGNFQVTNACATYLDDTNGNKVFSIGGSLVLNNGYLRFKQSGTGAIVVNITGSVQISNSSFLYGIYQQHGAMTFNAAGINQSSGNFYGIYNGDGNPSFNISGVWSHSGGDFRGIQNNATFSAGTPVFVIGSVSYTGGIYMANYSCNASASTTSFTVNGNLSISYSAATDIFAMNRLATLSTTASAAKLYLQVGGNLDISGAASGEFNSNNATGDETIVINGQVNISNGNNYFNVVPDYGNNGHATTSTIAGNVSINGGNTYFSAESGALTANLNGNLTISSGTLSIKGRPGTGTVNLAGNFLQSAGVLNLYNNASVASGGNINMTVHGNFTQSGGTISFSTHAASTAINALHLKGAQYTIGPSGSMTRAGSGTASVFGLLNFSRNGSILMSRSGAHDIQQVKQYVISNCSLEVQSGNVQVASHANAATDYFTVQASAVLNLNANQVFSNATALHSGIQVLGGGRLRTSRSQGLYDNTAFSAISNAGAMNFYLDQLSTVEYYGTASQILTGINLGLATGNDHKYGILEVNNTGTGTFVIPTDLPSAANAVYIRQELRLTEGVLNLAGAAGNPATGGRTVYVERADPLAVVRTNGILRSEAQDHSAKLSWNLSSVTGVYTVPFGYSLTEYIPLVYTFGSGTAGYVSFSTYHTAGDNLPWPPSINNLNSEIGLSPDNRDATVDRFWRILPAGTPVAELEFNYLLSELPAAPYNSSSMMRAQHYDFGTNKWQPAFTGQNASAYKVEVPSITVQTDWTLANLNAPLPVEWLYFHVKSVPHAVRLNWATAMEENNDHFIIERSATMQSSEQISIVQGAGNSAVPTLYEAMDKNPLNGVSYYRLRQVDYDGREEVTEWNSVYRSLSGTVITAGPNPVSDVLFFNGIEAATQVELTDLAGKLVMKGQLGVDAPKMDLSTLPTGIYHANVLLNGEAIPPLRIVKK